MDRSSSTDLKKVLEYASNQDINDAISKMNQTYEKIANNFIRSTKFFLTRILKDRSLKVYIRKGDISSASFSKTKEKGLIGNHFWTISYFGRYFLEHQNMRMKKRPTS